MKKTEQVEEREVAFKVAARGSHSHCSLKRMASMGLLPGSCQAASRQVETSRFQLRQTLLVSLS